jgi:hypothetical protein
VTPVRLPLSYRMPEPVEAPAQTPFEALVAGRAARISDEPTVMPEAMVEVTFCGCGKVGGRCYKVQTRMVPRSAVVDGYVSWAYNIDG